MPLRVLLFAFVVFSFVPCTLADRQLNIPPTIQQKSKWCWAACCEMVLAYYSLCEAVSLRWA